MEAQRVRGHGTPLFSDGKQTSNRHELPLAKLTQAKTQFSFVSTDFCNFSINMFCKKINVLTAECAHGKQMHVKYLISNDSALVVVES